MESKHIDDVNATGQAFKEALQAMVEINRKQADRGDLAVSMVDAVLTGTVATEEMQRLADIAAKHAPEKTSAFAPAGKRPAPAVVPARTAANGSTSEAQPQS